MSVTFIKNQPIVFDYSNQFCGTEQQEYCLLYENSDRISFQALLNSEATNLILDPTFSDGLTYWQTESFSNWTITGGQACHTAGLAGYIFQDILIFPTTTYKTRITVSGRTTGSLIISFGSSDAYTIDRNGVYEFYGTNPVATTAYYNRFSIYADVDFDGCVDNCYTYRLGQNMNVGVFDLDGNYVTSANSYITYADNVATLNTSPSNLNLSEGCYRLKATDNNYLYGRNLIINGAFKTGTDSVVTTTPTNVQWLDGSVGSTFSVVLGTPNKAEISDVPVFPAGFGQLIYDYSDFNLDTQNLTIGRRYCISLEVEVTDISIQVLYGIEATPTVYNIAETGKYAFFFTPTIDNLFLDIRANASSSPTNYFSVTNVSMYYGNLINLDFSEGTFAYWTAIGNWQLDIPTSRALNFNASQVNAQTLNYIDTTALTIGQTYTVSFSYFTVDGKMTVYNNGVYISALGVITTSGNYSYTFVASSTEFNVNFYSFSNTGGSAANYFYNVELTPTTLYNETDYIYESNCLNVGADFGCTKTFEWTDVKNGFGFQYSTAPFTQFLRLVSEFLMPKYQQNVDSYDDTTYRTINEFATSRELIEVFIDSVPRNIHRCIALARIHNNFTIDGVTTYGYKEDYEPIRNTKNKLFAQSRFLVYQSTEQMNGCGTDYTADPQYLIDPTSGDCVISLE